MNTNTNMNTAITICKQLGGVGKLKMMTGAYNFFTIDQGVAFRFKNKGKRINAISIRLNHKDLYDVKFSNVRKFDQHIVKQYNDVYFDQLIPIFEETTGLYLTFGKVTDWTNPLNNLRNNERI